MIEILAPMDYQIGPVLYSAALHGGLDAKEFHRRCDGKGATLLVIETDNGCVCVCMCMDVCMFMLFVCLFPIFRRHSIVLAINNHKPHM